jgi:hypothetical protein
MADIRVIAVMETYQQRLNSNPYFPCTTLGRAKLVANCLFVHPFSHTCNTGHVNYRLQFIYYKITYNIINNNIKFKTNWKWYLSLQIGICVFIYLYL